MEQFEKPGCWLIFRGLVEYGSRATRFWPFLHGETFYYSFNLSIVDLFFISSWSNFIRSDVSRNSSFVSRFFRVLEYNIFKVLPSNSLCCIAISSFFTPDFTNFDSLSPFQWFGWRSGTLVCVFEVSLLIGLLCCSFSCPFIHVCLDLHYFLPHTASGLDHSSDCGVHDWVSYQICLTV